MRSLRLRRAPRLGALAALLALLVAAPAVPAAADSLHDHDLQHLVFCARLFPTSARGPWRCSERGAPEFWSSCSPA